MAGIVRSYYVCSACARSLTLETARASNLCRARVRHVSSVAPNTSTEKVPDEPTNQKKDSPNANQKVEQGPMARRLEEATDEALFSGGRAGLRAVEDAGFSDELKERLLAKVQDAHFRSENAAAFAEAGLSPAAGQGTRLIAASQPWTGEESTEDAVLRMLNDAHKPLKPSLRGPPRLPDLKPVDMRFSREKASPGKRAAGARERAAVYTDLGMKEKGNGLSEEEREAMRKEFRERFRPAARAMPTTLTGLASLANERIEDAIARGQFKNIPRGKGVERDTRPDNPFIDTTEYIMNKMIKRQDIVPPWIEKQQELVKTAHAFRTRLRNDWKRYAARMIASKGGSLEEQMKRARRYAQAEEVHNPRRRNVEQIAVPTNTTDDPVMAAVRQQLATELSAELAEEMEEARNAVASATAAPEPLLEDDTPLPPPFRDPNWLRTEQSYMNLSINNLNSLTRSYNLMAPDLAKKPYFTLERELNAVYADVAPQLANAIKDRAARPAGSRVERVGHRPGGILDRFNEETHQSKIYDSKAPHYGFKEMWRDLFRREAG